MKLQSVVGLMVLLFATQVHATSVYDAAFNKYASTATGVLTEDPADGFVGGDAFSFVLSLTTTGQGSVIQRGVLDEAGLNVTINVSQVTNKGDGSWVIYMQSPTGDAPPVSFDLVAVIQTQATNQEGETFTQYIGYYFDDITLYGAVNINGPYGWVSGGWLWTGDGAVYNPGPYTMSFYIRDITYDSPAAVPEPATLPLFAGGLLGLAGAYRRKG